jgi:peptide/nickel transport system substrate-binding protein
MKQSQDGATLKIGAVAGIMGLILLCCAGVGVSSAQEKPQYGGIFVSQEPPSYDGHREETIGLTHTVSPHYSLLLKFDPENFPKVVGDLAESWSISADHKTYTFKIRKGVKFHDGSILTARDIKASYDKIIFPPPGVVSIRQGHYLVVEKVEAPDDPTVVFRLKRPSASFLATLASPFNYIYKADILAKDPKWYEKNIMGTGPFRFVEHVAGSHWVGKRNEDYFIKGRPYLDGYRSIHIKDDAARVAAIRAGRVTGSFTYNPPSQRDDLVRALGDKIKVEEISSSSGILAIINCEKKPFNDPRLRRAMTLAFDRWEGSKILYRISNTKEVGGLFRPGSEFAMNEAELTRLAGFSKDIGASRKEARRLLREAGIPEGFSFELKNRAVTYEKEAIWFMDQWRQVGLNATQKILETGVHYKDMRSGNFQVLVYSIHDYMDEPDIQLARFISSDKSQNNYSRYVDRVLDDLYEKQSQAMDPVERKKLCRQFQIRVLDEMAYVCLAPWRHRIVPYYAKVKGWKALPSHYLNWDLTDVWLSGN